MSDTLKYRNPPSRNLKSALKSSLKKPSSISSATTTRTAAAPTTGSTSFSRANPPPPQSPIQETLQPLTTPSEFQRPPFNANIHPSDPVLYISELWNQYIPPSPNKLLYFGIIYLILALLIAKDHSITAQKDVKYLTETLKLAGDFSESIDDGYLFELVPLAFRDAARDLREYYSKHVKSDNELVVPMHNLLSNLETIDFSWEAFADSRDLAISNVKSQVQASREIFQKELERAEKGGFRNRWLRVWKCAVLDQPYGAGFEVANYGNITAAMENYLDTWHGKTIPELRHRLSSDKRGIGGGLLGQMNEVEDMWPSGRVWGDERFRLAPTDEVHDMRLKALSVLGLADRMYERLGFGIRLLEKEREGRGLQGKFGSSHLKSVVGAFDGAIKRLEDAEWKVRERWGSRTE